MTGRDMEKSHYEQVVELLRMEADAIACAAGRIGREQVERAVEVLAACRGKVVTVGVGKSGNIAQKVAATLTCAGTVSVFLELSDVVHRQLGVV